MGFGLVGHLAINLLCFTSFSVHVLSFPSLGWLLLPSKEKARLHKFRHNESRKTSRLILTLQRLHVPQIGRATSHSRGAWTSMHPHCPAAGLEQLLGPWRGPLQKRKVGRDKGGYTCLYTRKQLLIIVHPEAAATIIHGCYQLDKSLTEW